MICTHLNLCDAVDFAVQRATQVGACLCHVTQGIGVNPTHALHLVDNTVLTSKELRLQKRLFAPSSVAAALAIC